MEIAAKDGGLAALAAQSIHIPITPEDDGSEITTTEDGSIVKTNPDGSIEIHAPKLVKTRSKGRFGDNIAEEVDSIDSLASDIIRGIEADLQSCSAMIASYTDGIDMLGLKREDRSKRRQRKNTSTIRHPIMLEAVIDAQSSMRNELLPATGPVKVAIEGGLENLQDNALAAQLEDDLNYYLTTTCAEYYPDMDRGLFYLAYGGAIFKKIYRCPIRRRPVSDVVQITDLIVNQNAVDLNSAIRVTHKTEMSKNDAKRMQRNGVWVNIELGTPAITPDPVKSKIKTTSGVSPSFDNTDSPYVIYECYTDIVPSDYGFSEKGIDDDIPLPYRITIERDSRQILDVRRNWNQDDKLYQKQLPFVMFPFIPAMGFLPLGFLHLLGNQTLALTAIWRILVDAGMFSNFPGGVRAKGPRSSSNEINPGPGEWAEVDVVADDIRKSLMPFPYREPSQTLIQLSEIIDKNATQLVGVTKTELGEGLQNVPVGTILATIEQQTKNMSAIHKRLHNAQQQEFIKLRDLLAETPEILFKTNPKARQWKGEELKDMNLVPVADPNVPSQQHRIMLAMARVQMAQQNPQIYDQYQTHLQAWASLGVDASSFIHQPAPQQPQQDPKAMAVQAQMQGKQMDLQIKQAQLQMDNEQQQREAADRVVQSQTKQAELHASLVRDAAKNQSEERIAAIHEQTERLRLTQEAHGAHLDRQVQLSQQENKNAQV